ncbi:SDR family NAD(P)-dependent oxidoreductase [Szabonella alba]|uniref:SDR family NAD(P)-dependent oxidoreductase n=1 Tax=Szabonella alba TaxID=2804194 RepID=A0A8K0V7V9_9RHOB|nr:SDR family NAD(P)-dependent oxidoreductase [Szabonella alba]MBL4916988.1 SDR family NAD(P)-dependent oxidoreductase [Szabonella alba]
MRDWQGKRYWLVGASEGLGLALARQISTAGAEVILSARDDERLARAAAGMPGRVSHIALDVADSASIRSAAATVGPVDGLVFLAGVYWPMKAQDWDTDKVEAMCDVNFTGCARMLGAVLPEMVARGQGHVVLTGSLAGMRGLPGAVGYAASKAGVMALAESLHADLRGTGVEVQLANPGFIRTRLTDKNDFNMPFIMDPDTAAREMFEHMQTDHFKKSFPMLFSWLFRLSKFLPDWAYYRLFAPK